MMVLCSCTLGVLSWVQFTFWRCFFPSTGWSDLWQICTIHYMKWLTNQLQITECTNLSAGSRTSLKNSHHDLKVSNFESIHISFKTEDGVLRDEEFSCFRCASLLKCLVLCYFYYNVHLHFLHVKFVCVIEIKLQHLLRRKKFSKDKDSFCSSFHVSYPPSSI